MHYKINCRLIQLFLIFFILPASVFAQSSLTNANKLFKDKKYKKAIVEYTFVASTNPSSIEAFVGRGDSYYELKEYKTAITDYSKSLIIDSGNTSVLIKRAGTYYLLKEYENAINDYTALISLHYKDISKIYFLRGLCKSLLPTEDIEGACEDFKKAKSLGFNTSEMNGLNKYCNTANLE